MLFGKQFWSHTSKLILKINIEFGNWFWFFLADTVENKNQFSKIFQNQNQFSKINIYFQNQFWSMALICCFKINSLSTAFFYLGVGLAIDYQNQPYTKMDSNYHYQPKFGYFLVKNHLNLQSTKHFFLFMRKKGGSKCAN